jgi:hypothetical protein
MDLILYLQPLEGGRKVPIALWLAYAINIEVQVLFRHATHKERHGFLDGSNNGSMLLLPLELLRFSFRRRSCDVRARL